KGPHTWARRYIRPNPEGFLGGGYLPIEDARGALRDINALSGGVYILEKAIRYAIEAARDTGNTLDAAAEFISVPMAMNFPGLSSLSEEPDLLVRQTRIIERITKRLRSLEQSTRLQRPEDAARDIARELLEDECKRSGKTDDEIRRAFKFLDH